MSLVPFAPPQALLQEALEGRPREYLQVLHTRVERQEAGSRRLPRRVLVADTYNHCLRMLAYVPMAKADAKAARAAGPSQPLSRLGLF